VDHPAHGWHLGHLQEDFGANFQLVLGAQPKSVLSHVDQDNVGATAVRLDYYRLAIEGNPPFAAPVYARRQIHARRHFGPLVKTGTGREPSSIPLRHSAAADCRS